MAISDHPNARLARRLWEATADGDVQRCQALYAPDVVWCTHGQGVLAGEFKGVCAVIEQMARAGELVDDMRSELLEVFANDGGAVLRYRVHAERGAQVLDEEILLALRIRGERVVRADAVPVDQQANRSFWRLH
jgi:ketosteroid isomerase-like protein